MAIEVILKNLVDSVPDAIGAILVDWEGEAVLEYCHCGSYEMRFYAAHKGIILAHIKEFYNRNKMGSVLEVVVTTGEMHLMIGCVDDDYSLVMNVGRSCPVAQALYHFRQAIPELKKEI